MTRLVPTLPRRAWLVLAGDALSAIGTGMTLPFFVVYLHNVRHIDIGIAELALATVAFASLAGNPTGGVLADRIGSRRAVILGTVLAAAGTGSIAFVSEPWQAFAAAAASGFGLAVFWPAFDSLLAVSVHPDQRSAVFGVRHATLNAGFGIGGLIAAAIVAFDSVGTFQVLYLVDAVSFIALVPILFALRGLGDRSEPEEGSAQLASRFRNVLADRVFLRVVVLTIALFGVGYAQMNAAYPAFATGPGGLSAKGLAIASAANPLAVMILQLPVLQLAQRIRRTSALCLVFGLWALTWAVTLVAGGLGGGAAAVAVFAAAGAIFALGETFMSPALGPLVNDLASDQLRGRYNALYTLGLTTGSILGPAVAGAALSAGQARPLFLALIVGCGLGALVVLELRRRLPAGVDLVGQAGAEPPIPTLAPGVTTLE